MPPRKKPRLSSRATSTPSGDVNEPSVEQIHTPVKVNVPKSLAVAPDAWTDEQETSLFKGMIRWKPVGMHKHFRMIAISQHLRNHGYTTPQDDHTRIPYIWEKLGKLYNLEALDERENFVGDQRSEDKDRTDEPFCPFTLPDDVFGEMMFAKRLKAEGSLSPPSLPNQLSGESDAGTRRQSTIDDTDDPRSSPASAPGPKSKRSRGTRKSQLQEVSIPLTSSRASKASMDDGTEDDENEDAEGNDDPPKPPTRAAPKPATNKAKKRRSTRRR